jgi:glycine cleavage system H protein
VSFPTDRKYTQEHEWALKQGNLVVIGITEHAQSALGDVVYCELPEPGRMLKSHETFGVVESIKAVSDLYSPITGKVVEVNDSVKADPSQLNRDPHSTAWLIKLEPSNPAEIDALMDAAQYQSYVATLK